MDLPQIVVSLLLSYQSLNLKFKCYFYFKSRVQFGGSVDIQLVRYSTKKEYLQSTSSPVAYLKFYQAPMTLQMWSEVISLLENIYMAGHWHKAHEL